MKRHILEVCGVGQMAGWGENGIAMLTRQCEQFGRTDTNTVGPDVYKAVAFS